MLGHTHVLTGTLAGLLTLPVAPVTGPAEQIAWVVAFGGAAQIPDLDHVGSRAARMWGWLSDAAAHTIAWVSQGHRWGTHDAVLGTFAFYLAATIAAQHPISAGVVLAFTIGLALRAFHMVIPGKAELTVLGNLTMSIAGAWLLTTYGGGFPAWLPLAIVGGCLAHLAGDLVTQNGLPAPVVWVWTRRRIQFTTIDTGGPTEAVIAAALTAGCVWVAADLTGVAGPTLDAARRFTEEIT
jgi:membrane-bound metal-dependent hydrolase YbcI (DUF457 family)